MIVVGGEGRPPGGAAGGHRRPAGPGARWVILVGGEGRPPGGAAGGHRRRPAGPGARWVIVVGGGEGSGCVCVWGGGDRDCRGD